LTTIASSAELLENYRYIWDEAKQLKHFRRIQDNVKHMTHIVNDVFFLNQAKFEKLEFQPAPANLVVFFQEVIDELQSTGTDKYKLTFIHQGDCNQAYFDTKLLRQIITNLLSNAIKYSLNNGTIQVRLTCEEKKVCFQVADEGIGIPEEARDNLFKSFGRASNVGTIARTGVGLSIVKKCIDLHDGQIAAYSDLDIGTTFTVSLLLARSGKLKHNYDDQFPISQRTSS
jgi:signal transduction histidine kinase